MTGEVPQPSSTWYRYNAALIYLTLCGITGSLLGIPILFRTGDIDRALLVFLVSPLLTFCLLPLYWLSVGCAAVGGGVARELPTRVQILIPIWMWYLSADPNLPTFWSWGFVKSFMTLTKPRVRMAFFAIIVYQASIVVIASATVSFARSSGLQDKWITLAGVSCGVVVGTLVTLPLRVRLIKMREKK